MGRRRRRKPSPISNSFVVAAYNSRDRVSADYVCNGVADEVEINLAFAALGIAEGVVVLMEGEFITAASIAFTANNQTLRGQGRSTYINGTGLPAGAHAIVLSGFTDCSIWDLAVETLAGGGDVTHCVFIEDGADGFTVRDVTIVDSDDDGIHIEGTTINQGHIHLCHVEAADGEGIRVVMDAANFANRFHVEDNDVVGCGGDGIHFATVGENHFCQVINNIVFNCTLQGIYVANLNYGMVRGNISINNGDNGIEVLGSLHAQFIGNLCQGNTDNGIFLGSSSDFNLIAGNTCQGNGGDGMAIGASSDCTVTGNVCQGNTECGIKLEAGSGNGTVTGNTCRNNVENGIYIRTTHDCTVSGNTCVGNDSGDTNAFDGIFISISSRNLIVGNQCQENDRHGIFVDGDSDNNKIIGNYLANNPNGDMTVGAATCDHTEIVWNTIEDGVIGDAGTLTRHSGNFDPSADAYIVLQGAAPF